MNDGTKLDTGKPKLADMLICFKDVLPELCKIYEFGVNKYGDGNWKLVENGEQRFKNALIRHFVSNTDRDEETGCLESAHIAYNALMVLWFEIQRGKGEIKTNK